MYPSRLCRTTRSGCCKERNPVCGSSNRCCGNNLTNIYGQVRKDNNRYYVVLMNMDRNKKYDSVTITLPYAGNISLWDCKTGKVWKQPTNSPTEEGSVLFTSFEPIEEKVYTISAEYPTFAADQPTITEKSRQALPDTYEYTLNEPNICVLDVATWQLDEGEKQPIDRDSENRPGTP